MKKPRHGIIGHRGALDKAPENTLASLQAAHALGLDWIEFDIQLSADGVWFLWHDADFSRLGSDDHIMRHLKADEISALKTSMGFPITTLSEALNAFKDKAVTLNIEVKFYEPFEAHHVETLGKQLSSFQSETCQLLLSSFSHDFLEAIRTYCPQLNLGFLACTFDEKAFKALASRENTSLNIAEETLTPEVLAVTAQFPHFPIFAFTVNELERYEALIKAGIWGIFTDKPETLIAHVKAY